MAELKELEKNVNWFEGHPKEKYTTEFQVITRYTDGTWDIPSCSFSDLQKAIEEAHYLMETEENISHCEIELQVSKDIEDCPEIVSSTLIAYVRNKQSQDLAQ